MSVPFPVHLALASALALAASAAPGSAFFWSGGDRMRFLTLALGQEPGQTIRACGGPAFESCDEDEGGRRPLERCRKPAAGRLRIPG